MLCIMNNPQAQKRAQAEIDAVVGQGRLPDFTDRDSLPFIDCLVKEVMRYVAGDSCKAETLTILPA